MSASGERFKTLPLGVKFPAGVGLVVAILLAVGAIQYRTIRILVETDRWVAHSDAVLAELEGTVSAVVAIESDARGYVATGDQRFVDQLDALGAIASDHLRLLRVLTADNPRQQGNLDRLNPLVEQRLAVLDQLIALRSHEGLVPATESIAHGEGATLMDEIRDLVSAMKAEENRLLALRKAAGRASATRAARVTVFGTLLALVVAVVAGRVIHKDIVARTQAEKTLRKTEERLNLAIAAGQMGIWELDLVNHTSIRSPLHDEIFGYPALRPDWGYEIFMTHVVPADRESVEKKFEAAFAGSNLSLQCRIQRADDHSVRWISAQGLLIRNNKNEPVRLVGTVTDITERKRAEAHREELASIVDNSDDAIIGKTLEGIIATWNKGAELLYGYSAGEAIGKSISILLLSGHSDDLRAIVEKLKRGEHIDHEETVRRRKDGKLINVSITISPQKDRLGRLIGASTIARDIGGRKQSEQAIRDLNRNLELRNAELAGANQELEAFTYSVAHDLRAPLRHAQGFSRAVLEDFGGQLPQAGQEYLNEIVKSTQHMGQLIDGLLGLAGIGRQALRLEVTSLNALLQEVLQDLKADVKDRDMSWQIGDLPFVKCDPGLMRQVFYNLIANAVKYTRPRHPAVIEVGQTAHDGQPAIFVKDNGVGFNMKYSGKLFGVFQRLHRREDFEGTGIGLATVQRIVLKHGGRIWAEAELDKGAAFYFTLAAAPAEESQAQPTILANGVEI